jgi:C1A family cysteine protease
MIDNTDKTLRAAPLPNRDDPVREKIIHVPGNWSGTRPLKPPSAEGCGCSNSSSGHWAGPVAETSFCIPGYNCLVGLGYHSDLPDCRDHGWDDLQLFFKKTKKGRTENVRKIVQQSSAVLPEEYNLGNEATHPLPPIENQGQTNSCTAQAAVGMLEYLYRWATGEYNDFSRMFIYFNSRKLLGWSGDTGANIRTTFKSMRLFGVPPEKEWPFSVSLMDAEPAAFHYAYAGNFKTLRYARLDSFKTNPGGEKGNPAVFDTVKRTIHAGFPVAFGFSVYSCIQHMPNFIIPVPSKTDTLLGGHAVLAVGYNNKVNYKDINGKQAKGALIIRNSWGPDWGDHGYGFLPRWYVDEGYATDFWTVYDENWLELGKFDA